MRSHKAEPGALQAGVHPSWWYELCPKSTLMQRLWDKGVKIAEKYRHTRDERHKAMLLGAAEVLSSYEAFYPFDRQRDAQQIAQDLIKSIPKP